MKIEKIMAEHVATARPHHCVAHVGSIMENNAIHTVPVVGPDNNKPLGIITASDLAKRLKDMTPISRVMTRDVTVVAA